jgi:phosphoglycolate phosphatase-like HAD superfamily hydrolase
MYKKLFIFDLDGTLVDAYRAIEASLNATRAHFGYSRVSYSQVRRRVGRGDRRFIEAFFKRKDAEKAVTFYRKHHKRSLVKFSRLMPGALRTLAVLKKRAKLVAIASNRPSPFTRIIVKTTKLSRYVDGVWCADEVKSLKPRPKILNVIVKRFAVDKRETVYIGDMGIDLDTARRARIDPVFVTTGSSSTREVKKFKKKKVIASLPELLKFYS